MEQLTLLRYRFVPDLVERRRAQDPCVTQGLVTSHGLEPWAVVV